MNFRPFFIAMLAFAVMSIGHPAYGIDELIDQPAIGEDFDATHTASKGQIIEIEGTLREDFPPFWEGTALVIPTGLMIELRATRASGDWDTHRYGEDCEVVEDPVADSLESIWPRWRCNVGEFVPLAGEATAEADLGTIVRWKAPQQESLYPGVNMDLFEDDVESWDGADDGGPLGEYGILQDRALLRALQPITLEIRNAYEHVTNSTPGPNAENVLGLWTGSDWGTANTMDENDNYVDTDHNGSARYEHSHPERIGTGLKTEVVAGIRIDPLLRNSMPANVKTAWLEENRWFIIQYKKRGALMDGQKYRPDDQWPVDEAWYWNNWTIDGSRVGDANWSMAVHLPPDPPPSDQIYGWLYFGDNPGFAYFSNGFEPNALIFAMEVDLKTGVQFFFNGAYCDIVSADDHLWGVYAKLIRGPSDWVVDELARPKVPGEWE